MIPMLILYTIRKYKWNQLKLIRFFKFKNLIKKVIAAFCLLILTSNFNDNPNGCLEFSKNTAIANKWVNRKIIKCDLHHCKDKFSIII